jgi:hypothetical protein
MNSSRHQVEAAEAAAEAAEVDLHHHLHLLVLLSLMLITTIPVITIIQGTIIMAITVTTMVTQPPTTVDLADQEEEPSLDSFAALFASLCASYAAVTWLKGVLLLL